MEERSSWISFCWGKIRQGSCNIGVERDVPKNQSETHSNILLWPLSYSDGHGSTYPTQATKTQILAVWREVGNPYGLWDNNSRFLESNTALRQPYVLPIWKKKNIYIYIYMQNEPYSMELSHLWENQNSFGCKTRRTDRIDGVQLWAKYWEDTRGEKGDQWTLTPWRGILETTIKIHMVTGGI